jgi:hypothetical protein
MPRSSFAASRYQTRWAPPLCAGQSTRVQGFALRPWPLPPGTCVTRRLPVARRSCRSPNAGRHGPSSYGASALGEDTARQTCQLTLHVQRDSIGAASRHFAARKSAIQFHALSRFCSRDDHNSTRRCEGRYSIARPIEFGVRAFRESSRLVRSSEPPPTRFDRNEERIPTGSYHNPNSEPLYDRRSGRHSIPPSCVALSSLELIT